MCVFVCVTEREVTERKCVMESAYCYRSSDVLQLLREKLTEYENRFKELEEKMDDVQAEKVTIDSTYKQSVKLMSCFRLLHCMHLLVLL